jgi:hypothetical protein
MHNYAANNNTSVMDYPYPQVKLDDAGNIDLSNAYGEGIGAWDKLAIRYGYQEFTKGTDEKKELNKLLEDGISNGLLFITDLDARAPGGAHPVAHLWDNGANASDELIHVLNVRRKALEKFSENNVKQGAAMSTLEDVLVPIYNYHRYQTEAAVKLVGSINYTYALRGDNQMITQVLEKNEQQKALNALLLTISPENLTLPENIIRLIPPRAPGLGNNRELFIKRTGLTFDPLAAAQASAEFMISLLLHPERASRLVELGARGENLNLQEVIGQLLNKTWMSGRQKGLAAQVQLQTEQVVLTHLMALVQNENASYQARAIATNYLLELKIYIKNEQKAKREEGYKAHLIFALERMEKPEIIKPTKALELPPGAPIGTGLFGCE